MSYCDTVMESHKLVFVPYDPLQFQIYALQMNALSYSYSGKCHLSD